MRRVATLVALALVAVACTEAKGPVAVSPSPSPAGSPVEVVTGSTTAAQAMKDLCIPADVEADPVTKVPTPPSIVEVEDQVEAVRDLRYERPVNVEPISDREMDRRLRKYFDAYYPEEYYDRRSQAWQTIGALPGTSATSRAWPRTSRARCWASTTRRTRSSSTRGTRT